MYSDQFLVDAKIKVDSTNVEEKRRIDKKQGKLYETINAYTLKDTSVPKRCVAEVAKIATNISLNKEKSQDFKTLLEAAAKISGTKKGRTNNKQTSWWCKEIKEAIIITKKKWNNT